MVGGAAEMHKRRSHFMVFLRREAPEMIDLALSWDGIVGVYITPRSPRAFFNCMCVVSQR